MEDVWVEGVLTRRRIKMPPSFVEWRMCWRVFRSIMLILDACPPGPLDAYEKLICELNTTFPGRWGIIATADDAMRNEEWTNYREEIREQVEAGYPPMEYDATRVWAAVVKRGAEDRNYWEDHVEKPINNSPNADAAAVLATLQHSDFLPATNVDVYADITGRERGPGGPYDPRPQPSWAPGAPNGGRPMKQIIGAPGGGRPQHPHAIAGQQLAVAGPGWNDTLADGRHANYDGELFCWAWCANSRGCVHPCPKGKIHCCEFCFKDHRTINCPHNRGFVHPKAGGKGNGDRTKASGKAADDKGKSKGKGDGKKGKGRKVGGRWR